MIRGSNWLAAAGMALALAGCDTVSNLSSQPAVAELDTRDQADASVNIASLSDVVSRNPNDPGAYNTRGAAYARTGRFSDATNLALPAVSYIGMLSHPNRVINASHCARAWGCE